MAAAEVASRAPTLFVTLNVSAERQAYQWHLLRLLAGLLAVRHEEIHWEQAPSYVQVLGEASMGLCFSSRAWQPLGRRVSLLAAVRAPFFDSEMAIQSDVLAGSPAPSHLVVVEKRDFLEVLEKVYEAAPLPFLRGAEVLSLKQLYAQRQRSSVAAAGFEEDYTAEGEAAKLVPPPPRTGATFQSSAQATAPIPGDCTVVSHWLACVQIENETKP